MTEHCFPTDKRVTLFIQQVVLHKTCILFTEAVEK